MKKIIIILSCFLIGLSISSCKKTSVNASKIFNVRMTDAPAAYTAVNIDIRGVEVIGNDGKTVMMNTNNKIYNILNFTNGKDTLLATIGLEAASVEQIRLILGSNNTVVVGGITYPLSTPSADQSGLKLQVHQTLQAGVINSITIDFDANQSIVEQGNGVYKLKPVLRTIMESSSGSIQGKISPVGTLAVVTAILGTYNLFKTNVNPSGDFKITGIPSGTYSIVITPQMPFLPSTQAHVVVETGAVTKLGMVYFQ